LSREQDAGQRQSEMLLEMVDELLTCREIRVEDLDGIAFGQGPGSFTGLRIACGVTQGLAFAAGLRVVGVGTLLAMAEATGAERVVCCLDARMHEVYHAAYERSNGSWKTVCEPGVYSPEKLPALPHGAWLGCGSGFHIYRDALLERYEGSLSGLSPDIKPHAREIVRLSVPLFEQNKEADAAFAAPIYIRDKVALRTDER